MKRPRRLLNEQFVHLDSCQIRSPKPSRCSLPCADQVQCLDTLEVTPKTTAGIRLRSRSLATMLVATSLQPQARLGRMPLRMFFTNMAAIRNLPKPVFMLSTPRTSQRTPTLHAHQHAHLISHRIPSYRHVCDQDENGRATTLPSASRVAHAPVGHTYAVHDPLPPHPGSFVGSAHARLAALSPKSSHRRAVAPCVARVHIKQGSGAARQSACHWCGSGRASRRGEHMPRIASTTIQQFDPYWYHIHNHCHK